MSDHADDGLQPIQIQTHMSQRAVKSCAVLMVFLSGLYAGIAWLIWS